jgi:hypothetical protein
MIHNYLPACIMATVINKTFTMSYLPKSGKAGLRKKRSRGKKIFVSDSIILFNRDFSLDGEQSMCGNV